MNQENHTENNIVTIENLIKENSFSGNPQNLYDAMNYIMQLGGKRVRPQMFLMACKTLNMQLSEDVFQMALAIETFHNFSLVHDDIMDQAKLRRGKPTVHEKWNMPLAILSGDNLLIKCYEMIANTSFSNKIILIKEFSQMATLICEGQQLDMNLASESNPSEQDYLNMIRLKTAELPAYTLKIAALSAHAENHLVDLFYQFGINLGMAFQLQDDYLDCYGTEETLGKKVGGDILENKKTVMFIHAVNHLDEAKKQTLINWYNKPILDEKSKINQVLECFNEAKSNEYLVHLKNEYENKCIEILRELEHNNLNINELKNLLNYLMNRHS